MRPAPRRRVPTRVPRQPTRAAAATDRWRRRSCGTSDQEGTDRQSIRSGPEKDIDGLDRSADERFAVNVEAGIEDSADAPPPPRLPQQLREVAGIAFRDDLRA